MNISHNDNGDADNGNITHRGDVVVLGAGVVGISSAYALARRGLKVVLVEREAGPALRTSFANGAQLSYAYSDTLGSPALLRKMPALLFGADPLFRIRFSPDPAFLHWGLKFLRSCSAQAHRDGTLAVLALALESRLALHALLERHPLSFGHAIPGKMHMYFDGDALQAAGRLTALKNAHGAVQHILSAAEARAAEPALTNIRDLAGVVYSPGDEVGDPYRFSTGLSGVLTDQYGMDAVFNTQADKIVPLPDGIRVVTANGARIQGRALVVALGIGAPAFLKRQGIGAAIQPLKGYSFTTRPGKDAPRVSITDTARKLVFCNLDGRIRVAGGAELGNWSVKPEPARLKRLIDTARQSMPDAADFDHIDSSWCDLRPMSPNSVPVIVRARPRVILNIGHGMLGWTLAMGAGERAAALVLKELTTRKELV